MRANTADPFNADVIAAALDKPARFRLEIIDRCESTSTLLLDRSPAGRPVRQRGRSARRQTAGRGRRGRGWLSAPADSLTFSLLWRFPPGLPAPAGLSLAAGVAVARALEGLGAAGIGLKWPNDILADGAKLGGILVETVTAGGCHIAVIGIGLNLRLPRAIAEALEIRAGSLDSVMPHAPSRNLLLAVPAGGPGPARLRRTAGAGRTAGGPAARREGVAANVAARRWARRWPRWPRSACRCYWAKSQSAQHGVRNLYERPPEQLGADRWAALIGARALLGSTCLVVCAGTATTIDRLDASGLFRGGLILPGYDLMRAALAANTAQLPLAEGVSPACRATPWTPSSAAACRPRPAPSSACTSR
jgi:hypothetical protein